MPVQNPSILPVGDLLDKTFVIPFFQRGYRWTGIEITALLEDLYEFQKKGTGSFYCLQPLVVVAEKEQENLFRVIDGQQRLTTIFLLLCYLDSLQSSRPLRSPFKLLFKVRRARQRVMKHEKFSRTRSPFKLIFDGRPDQQQFMEDKRFSVAGDSSFRDNIDNFYLRKAWETIKTWHEAKRAGGHQPDMGALLTASPQKYAASRQKYAAVIFYEIDEADDVDAFRRLNHGKIPLTSAEIVKALLLQSDCYADREKMAAVATLRGVEWDRMERDLADPYLGGMLGLDPGAGGSRMGLILDFVAEDLNSGLQVPVPDARGKKGSEGMDLFAYQVINLFLEKAPDRAAAVEAVWHRMQKVYNRIMNWRKNRLWYHLIGLYALLPEKHKENLQGVNLLRALDQLTVGADSKTVFEGKLKAEIGAKLRVPDHNSAKEVYPEDKQGLSCPDVSYQGEHEHILRRILTAFNVWTVYQDPDEYRLFPFHIFREKLPMTLEHIHPRSRADEMIPMFEATRDWWTERKASVRLLSKEEREALEEAVASLDGLLASREAFDAEKVREPIRTIENVFSQRAHIAASDIDSLANMALLDRGTNAAFNANLMDKKREILQKKVSEHEWIPPATQDVFSKKYSAGKIKNMQFWMPEDREAYLEAIRKVYELFVK